MTPSDTAQYLRISLRQVDLLEERGVLTFFRISAYKKITTKPLVDQVLQDAMRRELTSMEK